MNNIPPATHPPSMTIITYRPPLLTKTVFGQADTVVGFATGNIKAGYGTLQRRQRQRGCYRGADGGGVDPGEEAMGDKRAVEEVVSWLHVCWPLDGTTGNMVEVQTVTEDHWGYRR